MVSERRCAVVVVAVAGRPAEVVVGVEAEGVSHTAPWPPLLPALVLRLLSASSGTPTESLQSPHSDRNIACTIYTVVQT